MAEQDDPPTAVPRGPDPSADDREFDWRGWLLVGAVLVAFFVIPGAILYLPAAQGFVRSLGLTLTDAYLVLPLVPAFLLGSLAVWSAVRSRAE
ncbi:MAG: hypothetical protein ABEJ89_06870 [Haloarculaceae archaeon]